MHDMWDFIAKWAVWAALAFLLLTHSHLLFLPPPASHQRSHSSLLFLRQQLYSSHGHTGTGADQEGQTGDLSPGQVSTEQHQPQSPGATTEANSAFSPVHYVHQGTGT